MTTRRVSILAIAAAAAGLSCGSSNHGPPKQIGEIPIPNSPATFVFDIGAVDQGRYYLADRTNKALGVYNTSDYTNVAQIAGPFAGVQASSDQSGPDGVVPIPGTSIVYVGDVSSVKIVDVSAKSVVKTVVTFPPPPAPQQASGFRADEGCYDPDDKLMMFAHPGDSPPFATWISTTTQTVVARLAFADSAGLEQCVYDPGTRSFYLNNDGTTANAEGEVDVIAASSVTANAPAIKAVYPLGGCNPTGMTLGPRNELMVACTPDAGKILQSPILDRTNGNTLATVPLGGADQIAYDPNTNRYFLALRFWVDSGISIGAGQKAGYTPIFSAVDADTHAVVIKLPAGANDHSIAIDSANHKAFVPHTAGALPGFTAPGITVYSTD